MSQETPTQQVVNDLEETVQKLESLETEKLQEAQQDILKELYSLRSTLSKSITSEKQTMEDLYVLRETLKKEIDQACQIQDVLMKRDKRIGHLKKNLGNVFQENLDLKKENAELKEKLSQ